MSLYGNPSSTPEGYFPGIEVIEVGSRLSNREFEEFVGGLVIPAHFDMQGAFTEERQAQPLGETTSMRRNPEKPRDPWAPDHFFHTDRGYWDKINQFATVLYAQQLSGSEVAGTEFIDTSLLLDTVERDHPDITEALRQGTTVFSGAKYYTSVLAFKGSAAAIQRTLSERQCATLEEVAAKEAESYPPKSFPTVPMHPFRQKKECVMIDEARTADIEGTGLAPGEIQRIITQFVHDYLALPSEVLADRPYYAVHEWQEGQALIWPQIGTLHRAQASPAGELERNTVRDFIN